METLKVKILKILYLNLFKILRKIHHSLDFDDFLDLIDKAEKQITKRYLGNGRKR